LDGGNVCECGRRVYRKFVQREFHTRVHKEIVLFVGLKVGQFLNEEDKMRYEDIRDFSKEQELRYDCFPLGLALVQSVRIP
jgi:hypothetical protein